MKWSLQELDEVDSTQTVVGRLGAEGAPEGTVVVAKRQTAGRGRRGRSWVSPEGGLYMSLLLRPPSSARLPTLTLVAAAAVVRGITEATGLEAFIRWPNDVVVGGRKVSGVIAEASYSGQALEFVTIGVGANCNTAVSPADAEGGSATTLAAELGRRVDIHRIHDAILDAFGELYAEWLSGADAVAVIRDRVHTIGKYVVITTTDGKMVEGVAENVERTGGLTIRTNGHRVTLHAQDVEWLREK